MNKVKEKFNKKSIFYLTTILVLLIGIVLIIVLKHINFINKKITTDNYNFYYDYTWQVIKKDNSNITLKHNTDSLLKIKITTLEDYSKYENLTSSIDDILYSISSNNKEVKLIGKEQVKVNNNDAYKALYKKDNNTILITVVKESDKLILFEYTASNKYYDLVLDSANHVINSFRLSHKKLDLSKEINLTKTNIRWYPDRELNSKIKETREYTIAHNHYKVSYTIPKIFKIISLDTTKNSYLYKNIKINTSIENMNIYEYLNNSKNKKTIYYNYNYLKEKDDFREYLNQVKENEYCYKNTYYINKHIYENVELIYSLNKDHIFIVKLSGKKSSITKELIHKINLIKYSNYANNTNRNINSNKLIGELQDFIDNDYKRIESVIIKLPTYYEEIDHNNNLYDIRYYEDNTVKVKYYKILNIKSNNKLINKSYSNKKVYGPYKELVKEDNQIFYNKEFITYSGSYTDKNKLSIFTKILYYKLENKYLVIEIENTSSVDDILYNLTDFEVII